MPHIELRDGETGQWLARVGQQHGRILVTLNDDVPAGSVRLMEEAVRQLDFYFGAKQEPDPWLYALHHCTTAANIYSPVRWVDITGRYQQG